ncbi:236_t:CDS:2, partial [Entrophospora sp. SA101]
IAGLGFCEDVGLRYEICEIGAGNSKRKRAEETGYNLRPRGPEKIIRTDL